MSTEYDDPRDDDRGDPRDAVALAKKKTSTPGMLLIVAGLIGLALEVGSIGIMVTKPTLIYDFFVDMIEKQPDSPQKKQQLEDMKKSQDAMRLDSPTNIGSIVLGFALNTFALIGGIKMLSASGYGLSMAGAICSIIPIGGCCCIGMPVGIWALVVLMNPKVKDGFAAAGRIDPHDTYGG